MVRQRDQKEWTDDFCRKKCHNNDVKYDGLFFSGVSSTKIYCRSICPAGPPLKKNNTFYLNKAQAEEAGLRPCLRCRPELAPGYLSMKNSFSRTDYLVKQMHQGRKPDKITGPQLNEFKSVFGVTPVKYWKTTQLGFTKMLLTDTVLSEKEIAKITAFDTPTGMLDELFQLYQRDPVKVKKTVPVDVADSSKSCALHLFYRPPFDWAQVLGYFSSRAVDGVEKVTGNVYQRSFCLNDRQGWFSVEDVKDINALRLEVHASDLSCLMRLVWRVRQMFDLDADPLELKAVFENDPMLGAVWSRHPGVRVPVCWDPFESAVRIVAGQLISVKAATQSLKDIVETLADDLLITPSKHIKKLFPDAVCLSKSGKKTFGLTQRKLGAIKSLSKMVAHDIIDMEDIYNPDTIIEQCKSVKGIGEWTAQCLAMRGFGSKNAFPAGDLRIIQAMSTKSGKMTPGGINKIALSWHPYRSYAASLLWMKHDNRED